MKLSSGAAFLVLVISLMGAAPLRAALGPGAIREPVTAKEIAQGFRDRAFLAKPKAGLGNAEVTAAEASVAVRVLEMLPRLGGLRVLENPAGEEVEVAIARLRATGRYEFVEPDYVVHAYASPSDPAFVNGSQWALHNYGQSGGLAGADIRAPEAWDIQTSAADIIVAVIDSGIRVTHQDVAGNLWVNPGEIGGNGVDDDGNGYVDDVHGINATARTGNPVDDSDHGTGVASVIGAVPNNGVGLAGVAWNVKLMALRFIDASGTGFLSDELRCVDFAIAKRAHVINASFGGRNYSQSAFEALRRTRDAGIIVVCAAGNDTENNDNTVQYPSGYLLDNIVSVAATTRADVLASFSNFGAGSVDLAAPGNAIYQASSVSNTSYATSSGTSFSTPMVSGAIALLKARYPGDTYRQTINRLLRSTKKLSGLSDKVATGGRLDLAAALSATDTRPFNDDFAQRATLTGEDISARGASQGATGEAGEPAHAGSGGTSLWWTWAPKRTGPVTIDTTGSAFDTLLAVYTGSAIGGLTPVASNDNESAGKTSSKVSFNVTVGTTYQIAVDGKAGATGLAALNLLLLAGNDAFASAQPVTGRSFAVDGNNTTATRETGEPRILNKTGGRSLWYTWVAPATRRYHVSAFTTGAADTMLGIYTGTALSDLTVVASALDYGAGLDLMVSAATSFTAVAGTTYWIAVDTESGTTGDFTLALTDSEWEFNAGHTFYASPAVATDGTLYLADSYGDIYALNPDGTQKWIYELSGFLTYSTPAVGPDGTVYVGDSANYLYALRPDGTLKWRFLAGGDITSSPLSRRMVRCIFAVMMACFTRSPRAAPENGPPRCRVPRAATPRPRSEAMAPSMRGRTTGNSTPLRRTARRSGRSIREARSMPRPRSRPMARSTWEVRAKVFSRSTRMAARNGPTSPQTAFPVQLPSPATGRSTLAAMTRISTRSPPRAPCAGPTPPATRSGERPPPSLPTEPST